MSLLSKLVMAWCLMALCVIIHALGLALVIGRLRRRGPPAGQRLWPAARVLIDIVACAVLLHLLEIMLWAFLYTSGGAVPDLQTACYFSAVTYTTTGYGDVVLPEEWRLIGGIEALTGILMCGLSTGLFFTVFAHLLGHMSLGECVSTDPRSPTNRKEPSS